MLRTLISVVTVLCALSTPTLANGQTPEAPGTPQTLGLAVAVVEQLDFVRNGPMAFTNKRSSIAVPDDSIDALVASAVEAELAKEGLFQVKRLAIPSTDKGLFRRSILEAIGGVFTRSLNSVPDPLRDLASACSCDRLLLVLGTTSTDGTGSSQRFGPLSWIGLTGFNEVPTFSSLRLPIAFLLIDPSTMKLIADATSTSDNRDRQPFEVVDAKLWPKSMSELEPATWDALVQASHKLVNRTTRLPLHQIGLRPSCASRYSQRNRRSDTQGLSADDQQSNTSAVAAKCS